ncbi:hypothetical protein MON38_05355 [Hymenobacter sp. DH14]|uniref:Uncharacterized protein n=2 Tax=Hymenobacter cyanobacteriorum TaxID=2926463 RepID=A0A9X1VDR7_9BACT|nr:hypothetical protein [Hymenobacter cyanobacteriorum]
MQTEMIRIKVIGWDDGDGLLQYNVALSNGETATELSVYGYDDMFKQFGQELADFPQNIESRIKFCPMEDDDSKWANYLQFEVFCYAPNGAAAMRVQVRDGYETPYYYRCEFFILTVPATLNRLGEQLKRWNPREGMEFVCE